MTLSEFLDAKVLPLASKFRGNAKGFFAELRNVPREQKKERDGLVSSLENSFWRWENGTDAAARHGRFKTLFETLDGQSSATSAAIVSQAKHDPEGALASAMGHVEKLAAKAEAALAAKQASAVTYLQSVGREVVELATSPNPKVAGPIAKGIEKSLAAHSKITAAEFVAENAARTMTRAEFELLPHSLRGKFFKDGGRLVGAPEAEIPPLSANATTASWKQFKNLSHPERNAFFKRGGQLTEDKNTSK